MEIRNSAEALDALLGIPSPGRANSGQVRSGSFPGQETLAGDRATLSSAGTEVFHSAAESDVRVDKVAAVQKALASGTYNVPASEVAGKIVEAMMRTGETKE